MRYDQPGDVFDFTTLQEFYALLERYTIGVEWTSTPDGFVRTTEGYCPLCWVAKCMGKNPDDLQARPDHTQLRLPWILRNTIMMAADGALMPAFLECRDRIRAICKPRNLTPEERERYECARLHLKP